MFRSRRQVPHSVEQPVVRLYTRELIKLPLTPPVDGEERLLGTERRQVTVVPERDVGAVSSENQAFRRVARSDSSFVREGTINFIDDEH